MGAERLVKRECPSCGSTISLGARALNKKIRCPQCRHLVVVEDLPVAKKPDEAPAAAADPAGVPAEKAAREEGTPSAVPEPPPARPPDFPVLDVGERKILFDTIAAVERTPDRTHFVFLKELGVASGVYHVAPDNRQPLAELKAILNREPAVVEGPQAGRKPANLPPAQRVGEGAAPKTEPLANGPNVTESGETLEEIREIFRRNLSGRRRF